MLDLTPLAPGLALDLTPLAPGLALDLTPLARKHGNAPRKLTHPYDKQFGTAYGWNWARNIAEGEAPMRVSSSRCLPRIDLLKLERVHK
jgi:hypothetical protein